MLEEIIENSMGKFVSTVENADFKWLGPTTKIKDLYSMMDNKEIKMINRYPHIKKLFRKDALKEWL